MFSRDLTVSCVLQVIREYIQKYHGYEIFTEGDSFAVAFVNVYSAVMFAMDVQDRLTHTPWGNEVLRLPSCGTVWDKDGEVLRRGPKIRMGIHFANEQSIVRR